MKTSTLNLIKQLTVFALASHDASVDAIGSGALININLGYDITVHQAYNLAECFKYAGYKVRDIIEDNTSISFMVYPNI